MALSGTEKSHNASGSSFAVYLCNINRANATTSLLSSSSSAAAANIQERTSQISTEEEAFGLKLLSSSLTSEQECLLQLFLIRRLKKGAIYTGTGNFSGMEFSLTEKPSSPAVCYYILLPCGSRNTQSEQALICLLADTDTNLEVFRPELTLYCEALAQRIPQNATEFPKGLHAELSTWLADCVYYVCRVLNAMGEEVAILLQLAQQNRKVMGSDNVGPKAVADVRRFISSCAVVQYLGSINKAESTDNSPVLLKTGSPGGKLIIDEVNCNSYCMDWAQRLLSLGENCEPWKIRKVLEAFKLKTIKDMNTLKRFLKQSETDHYSLYRAYTFLLSSGNSDILLKQVKMEGSSAGDVIDVLEQHLNEMRPRHTPIHTIT
ncbi:protein Njmu-R1-like [Schistocerca gregaria]|uniref:protein Njmu-R1-like n=1 Tax=Schistocerca gregaria TaxID=7010 RepID=UPI00211F1125|nr:protein Njmu-R1-like [Schistocerca gregaria]